MLFGKRDGSAATGTSEAADTLRSEPNQIVIAAGPGYQVELIRVSKGTDPEYRPKSLADILCLDIHEFGFEETIVWVTVAQASAQKNGGMPLSIAVLGCTEKLTTSELWRISRELEPAGAIFHAWPEACHSSEEAVKWLAEEISKSYGRIPRRDGLMGEPASI